MSYNGGIPDASLAIAMGLYTGITHINKFGSIVNVTTDTTEDMWDGGGTYSFPATALMTHLSQTTDQTAARGSTWTLEGLDANYVEVTQTKDLDGSDSTTAVALTTPLFRINRMYTTDALVLTSTVRLHNAGETIDYTDVQTDHNQTLNAIYTVPAGKTAYLTTLEADYIPTAAKNPDSVHFHIYQRGAGEGWRVIESFGIEAGGGGFIRNFNPYVKITEKTDIRITVKPEAKDAHAHASFDLILTDNTIYG